MSVIAPSGGSAISAKSIAPSLHLSKLVDLIARSLEEISSSGAFIHCTQDRIIINVEEVLHHLYTSAAFKFEFAHGPDKGFVRDIEIPPYGTDARVGGRLVTGSEQALARAVNRLVDGIEEQIDQRVPAEMLSKLTEHSVAETIRAIAYNFGIQEPQAPTVARLTPVTFSSKEQSPVAFSREEQSAQKLNDAFRPFNVFRPLPSRAKGQNIPKPQDIARMFSAIEESRGGGGIERFIKGVSNVLQRRDYDEEIIAAIAQSLRMRAEKPGDMINRFLQFMEDEAHSRVRMQVAMRLMEAIANQQKTAEFKTYVERVLECFERFAGIEGQSQHFDVSIEFQNSNFEFSVFLRQAGFYTCLPVWPEWSVQMFEARPDSTSEHGSTVREVTYRFRVNGNNPESGGAAFDARIAKHENKIKEYQEGAKSFDRSIAELVFLWLVVPDNINNAAKFDVVAKTAEIAEKLKRAPKATLTEIIESLRKRSDVMVSIAEELITIIKNRSENVLKAAKLTTDSLRLCVSRHIIDLEAFASYTDDSDILVRSPKQAKQNDNVEWLKHLTVGKDVTPPHSLFSFEVTTTLQERSLTAIDSPRAIEMTPDLSERALPIRLTPFKKVKEVSTHTWEPTKKSEGALDTSFGIEIRYDSKDRNPDKDKHLKDSERADIEQKKAAAISAFAVLSYVTLWLLMRRIRTVRPGFSIMLLRVATRGRAKTAEKDKYNKSTNIYAISQALERALAREGNVKLQGYVTNGVDPDNDPDGVSYDDSGTEEHRKRSAVAALTSGQVLSFDLEGSLDRVALVSYVTRPCDTHPLSREPDLFLFACRTYVAERQKSGAQIRVARMRHQIIGSRDDFGEAQPILTELRWLESQGYKHVMLLSHHFGNRHLGRAAERHAPHGSREFLDKAHQAFPEMRFYTLRRDVFPATRLHKRRADESAFEVVTFADHANLYKQNADRLMRSIMPIYTFATLHVVGNGDDRPQSGFCTYFFDVERRMADLAWQEATRADILGFGGEGKIRDSLISVLRAVHFLESEKPTRNNSSTIFSPVLDPYGWVAPVQRAHAGEIVIMDRRREGTVILSLPALLSHITGVLKQRFPEKGAAS